MNLTADIKSQIEDGSCIPENSGIAKLDKHQQRRTQEGCVSQTDSL
jgi:hypothetical protein